MGRSLLLVALGVLAVTGGPVAGARAQAPGIDSVAGEASEVINPSECALPIPCLRDIIGVEARSDATGGNPTGTVHLAFSSGSRGATFVEANVTCLAVSGNVAIIGALGDHAGPMELDFYPVAVVLRVTDGGGPASGRDTWEILSSQGESGGPAPPAPTNCAGFLGEPVGPVQVNQEGDLVVHDAQELPTSKDECKNGGWRNYGTTFKNQGQCVAFAQRGPKG